MEIQLSPAQIIAVLVAKPENMKSTFVALLSFALFLLAYAKPTIYMKNGNDKLEPVLVPVSSTVIPIPVYQVSAGLGVKSNNAKSKKQKIKLSKPDGPIKLVTGLKKMASDEVIKPH